MKPPVPEAGVCVVLSLPSAAPQRESIGASIARTAARSAAARALSHERRRAATALRALPIILLGAWLLFWLVACLQRWLAADVWTYLAAGERLNAGHLLYALSPGDRAVVLNPPFWTAPLLYPPTIAVLWRPLAFAGPWIGWVWWLAAAASVVASVVWLLHRYRIRAAVAVALLAIPVAQEIALGNVSSFFLPGLLVAWYARPTALAGVAIAAMATIKLTPVALVPLLVASRSWRAVGAAVATGAAVTTAVVVLAGPSALAQYLDVARTAVPQVYSLSSLSGLPWLSSAVFLVGSIAVIALSERTGFVVAIATMVLGSPALNAASLSLLLAAIPPLCEPMASATGPAAFETERSA